MSILLVVVGCAALFLVTLALDVAMEVAARVLDWMCDDVLHICDW